MPKELYRAGNTKIWSKIWKIISWEKNFMKYWHNIQENRDITEFSNYKTPAKTRYFYEIYSEKQIHELYENISWARQNALPILWISGGTNILFAFDIYEWLIIKNSLFGWSYDVPTHLLTSFWAENIWDIAENLEQKYQQILWHRFIGLPGSIAGAVYGNAGCFWLEIENNFVSCQVLDTQNGQVFTLEKKDMDFSYRNSKLKKEQKYFLISAQFDLSEKKEKYHSDIDNINFRKNKQPNGNSCGSFFKNPPWYIAQKQDGDEIIHEKQYALFRSQWYALKKLSAGFLIEAVWLKWYKIWGAYFSEKHANFLMNDGTGSYKDMLDLIHLAEKKVFDTFAIRLDREVQII